MAKKTIEKCLEDILYNIEQRKTVDYGDKASVRAFNAAYDRVYKNCQYIAINYPDQISMLMKLCYHEDAKVAATCAPIIVLLQNCTLQQKQEAYGCIENLANSGSLDEVSSLGFQMWLKKYEKEYKQ